MSSGKFEFALDRDRLEAMLEMGIDQRRKRQREKNPPALPQPGMQWRFVFRHGAEPGSGKGHRSPRGENRDPENRGRSVGELQ